MQLSILEVVTFSVDSETWNPFVNCYATLSKKKLSLTIISAELRLIRAICIVLLMKREDFTVTFVWPPSLTAMAPAVPFECCPVKVLLTIKT